MTVTVNRRLTAAMWIVALLFSGCATVHDRWANAQQADSIQSYERFLQMHPESQYTQEVHTRLNTLRLERDWREIQNSDSIEEYETFLERYRDSRYSEQARFRLQHLRQELAVWKSVAKRGSLDAYKDFLQRYPNNSYAVNAKRIVIEHEKDIAGWSIVDALKRERIEVQILGSDIQSVTTKMRRRVDRPIKVIIPAGSYFVCDGASQNMISRRERRLVLDNDTWQTVSVPAACADHTKPIPGSKVRFTVRELPRQSELKRLVTVLEEENVPFDIEQAAIWIVTDDADYASLGTLVSRSSFQLSGGTRLIDVLDAARAMRLCFKAGIDVRGKAIWQDRSTILQRIRDERGEMSHQTVSSWFPEVEGRQ